MSWRSFPLMRRFLLSLLALVVVATTLSACGRGGERLDPQDLVGEISFPTTADLFGGATLNIRIRENDTGAQQVTEYVQRGVNMFPAQFNLHAFSMRVPELQDGETYVIDIHVDVDLDGVISAPDFVTAETVMFVAKSGLDPMIIQVVNVQ